MSGDIDKVSVWDDADVFVSFDLEADLPSDASDDFGLDWERVGFLDGSAGFSENVAENITSLRVWGQPAVRRTYKPGEVTVNFTAMERNATTERLARVNNRERVLLAFETREGDRVYRKITKEYAVVSRNGAITDNEDALTGIPLQAWIAPDTTIDPSVEDQFWTEQDSDAVGS